MVPYKRKREGKKRKFFLANRSGNGQSSIRFTCFECGYVIKNAMGIVRVSLGKITEIYEQVGKGQASELILASKEIYFHPNCFRTRTGIDMT